MSNDTFEKYLKWQEELDKQVAINGDCIVINVAYEYEIELSRCNTPEKILAWAYHLTEKTWMNSDLIAKFIEVAAEQIDWDPHLPV